MIIKFKKLYPDAIIPQRASSGAVGYDVAAYQVINKLTRKPSDDLLEPAYIQASKSKLFGIGISFALPDGVDCQVRPRSGLANKYDIELSNSPGTVDPDYRGEVSVLLRNRGTEEFAVEKGMRIAQLVFTRVLLPDLVQEVELSETKRDTGGFGSTGLHEISNGIEDEAKAEQLKRDQSFMAATLAISNLSDCLRVGRKFGCLIVKDDNIIAQGYNHMTSDCSIKTGCIRNIENMSTGQHNDRGCDHAEEAAILNHGRTGGPSLQNSTLYVNSEPCIKCAKMIIGCGISTVVVPGNVYPVNGLKFLSEYGIEIRQVSLSSDSQPSHSFKPHWSDNLPGN